MTENEPDAVPEDTENDAPETIVYSNEEYTVKQLSDLSKGLSVERKRLFANGIEYVGEEKLSESLESAKELLPEVESAYQPSGNTTATSRFIMIVSSPFLLLFLILILGGLCVGWRFLEDMGSGEGGYNESRGLGLVSFIVNIVVFFLMIYIPKKYFQVTSRLFKNRSPKLPGILTFLTTFIVGLILFVPYIGGFSLAPTDLILLIIPVKWLIILLGILVVPLMAAAATYGAISEQKFCEQTGLFLKPLARVNLPFDFVENALELLKRGEFQTVLDLATAMKEQEVKEHVAQVVLWGNERANTSYVEMTAGFHGTSKPEKKMSLEESKSSNESWMIFSSQLENDKAKSLVLSAIGNIQFRKMAGAI